MTPAPDPTDFGGSQIRDAIQAAVPPLTKALHESVTTGGIMGTPKGSRAIAYRRLYDYLCCEEVLATRDALADSNVLLVPGARRGHVFRA